VDLDLMYLYRRRHPRRIAWRDGHSAPAARSRTVLKLYTGCPMMRLSSEFARQLRGEEPTAVPHPRPALPPAPEPGATPVRPVAEVEECSPHQVPPPIPTPASPSPTVGHVPPAPTPGTGVPSAPHQRPIVAATGHGRRLGAPMIQDFLQTMEQFLVVQELVMQDCLRSGRRPANRFGHPGPPLPTGRPSPADRAYPLLGSIVSRTPGEELVARRTFDPAKDLYLRDHTLGRAVSDADPDLLPLAIMPLTMSLEILAEAAASLMPGRTVVGLRDVRAHRWIAFDGRPQTCR
jgi:hypothetical protein